MKIKNYAHAKKIISDLQQQVNYLQSSKSYYISKCNALIDENNYYRPSCAGLEVTIARLREQNAVLQAQVDSYNNTLNNHKHEIHKLQELILNNYIFTE